ncbi:uncharacterized protein LOC117602416 isoform X2 [Osmia lignaria lignaria]|uniref:uncharacterized protein LOC117602416 isoform X2 n=1 Tax=Osmia lignaria lignaria TaxID=1437193 RepID=UPI0014785E80|nr:uncharacterized protein LOC117602416 isoform X2 [Osmia lignaria]
MKHKMITTFQLILCLILILNGGISTCKPLSSEDVEGLLPPTPRDKNETIAAVVQDPVVQDAVQKVANNGSLNGLVVKKNVFIMPASNPNMILSKREHILVVPTENLEDVRKNITETKQTEAAMETSSPESEMSIESDADEYMPVEIESGPQQNIDLQSSPVENPGQSMLTNEQLKSKTEFLEDAISHDIPLPEDQPKKVPVPIIAVIDPSKAEKGKVNSPIVAILPNQLDNDALKNQVQFLNDNNDVIQKKAQDYIDQSSFTIVPDYRKSSTPSEITLDLSSIQETVPVPVSSWSFQQDDSLKPITMSRWEMIVPAYQDDNMDHSREKGDMDVAEDIVFRPLFKYRQQMQQRSKYYDESNRRYGGYSNNYPRRAYFYRPRYDNY